MRIGIVGAGITGLALGWYLKQRFKNELALTIFEKESTPGGWIRTVNQEGFLFEKGPRSFLSKGHGVVSLQLIEALGLKDQVIAASSSSRVRYLYQDQKLRKVPSNFYSFLFSPLMQGVIPALIREWWIKPSQSEDETIYDFISRRLTPTIAERLVDPMVSGIFGGDIRELSIKSCFPKLHQFEQREGSILKGMLKNRTAAPALSPWMQSMQKHPILSFYQGMETLVKVLSEKLSSHLELGKTLTSVAVLPNSVQLQMSDGHQMDLDYLFLAIPAEATGKLLAPLVAPSPSKRASIVAINLGWKEQVLKWEGFGYLIPTQEREQLLGVVWDSSAFPQQNRGAQETRLTAMLGGVHKPELLSLPQDKLIEISLKSIYKQLGISKYPNSIRVNVALDAIPQYLVGHQSRTADYERKIAEHSSSRIRLCGNSWHGVGVNDCIFNACKLSETLFHK
jgi:protoporphyrinogen/coproporphyrinogen III oxidase